MLTNDADLLRGGPGDAEGHPAPRHGDPAPDDRQRQAPASGDQPQLVKIQLGGQTFSVPAETAAALRRERDRIAGEFGSRLQHQEARLRALEADQDDEPADTPLGAPTPPNAKDLIDDPEKYHRDNLAWQQHLVQSAVTTVEQRRYEEREAEDRQARQNAAWNQNVAQFYRNHPELRGNEDIVDAVWRNKFNDLKDLPVGEGFEELAKLSKQRILQLSEHGKRIKAPRTPTLETSGGQARHVPRQPREEEPDTPTVGGLSLAIKKKQRLFRHPDFGGRRESA